MINHLVFVWCCVLAVFLIGLVFRFINKFNKQTNHYHFIEYKEDKSSENNDDCDD